MADKVKDVLGWVERDFRFGKDDVVEIVENRTDPKENRRSLKFYVYTDTNVYSIVAKEQTIYRLSYLGCQASSRKPRAGEDWTRGNDLADGPLSEKTWQNILADIVSYELVKVHKQKKDKVGVQIDKEDIRCTL